MPALLEDTQCTICPHQHNFSLPEGQLQLGRSYDYICPETGTKTSLSPKSVGEFAHFAPQGAIALVPAVDRSQSLASSSRPDDETTRLQSVLPEVKDLAGKVGGMDHLADLVKTLKEAKEGR